MVKSTECRIGNIVNWAGHLETLTGDDIMRMEECEQSGRVHGKQPILLTPEILEQCGFANRSGLSDFYFILNDFIIGGSQRSLYPSIHGESGLEAIGIKLVHLHQLQNLYFALTGEELKVSLIPA